MDDRFNKILSDPKFRTIKKKDRKTKIDNRFKSMFKDEKFTMKFARDKRGKVNRRHMSEDYKRFYQLSDEEDDIEEADKKVKGGKTKNKAQVKSVVEDKEEEEGEKSKSDLVDEKDKDEDNEKDISKGMWSRKLTHNFGYHRGIRGEDDEDDDEEDSSSSSSESEEEAENEELEHEWNELDRNAQRGDGISRRVAICNADWDRFNAQDIFVLLNSFKPPTGVIESVKVYYSKFGEERLKVEETKGPSEFIYGKGECIVPKNEEEEDDDEDDEDDEEADSTEEQDNMEKLRKYQLERLKYFFALVICDSPETGDVIYKELDGMEYESSSTMLDLRFVPDEMDFEDVKLKEECSSMPNTNYKPPEFINTALQQSQVKLTWDETDPRRKQVFDKAFEKDLEDDLKAYLASSSDEDDNVNNADDDDDDDENDEESNEDEDIKSEDKIAKYKKLLSSLDKDQDEVDMEITWDPNLEDKILNKDKNENEDDSKDEPHSNSDRDDSEEDEDDEESEIEEVSPSEDEEKEEQETKKKFQNNRKNMRKNKNKNAFEETEINEEEATNLDLLMMDVDNNNGEKKKHFNYKDIVNKYSKNQPIKDDDFKFNAEDPRFSAMYNSHLYNVDQSDPNFKRTDAFKQIIENKKKRGVTQYQSKEKPNKPEPSWKSLAKKMKFNAQQQDEKNKLSKPSKFHVNSKFKR